MLNEMCTYCALNHLLVMSNISNGAFCVPLVLYLSFITGTSWRLHSYYPDNVLKPSNNVNVNHWTLFLQSLLYLSGRGGYHQRVLQFILH